MDSIRYYIPGALIIFIGILIVAVPEILIAFVASLVLVAGIGVLYLGHRIRTSEEGYGGGNRRFGDEDFFGRRFAERPIFRDWRRRF
jgi:prepilin signal peptidase PulO-like enzyme (type II secretory pathway)